MVSISKETARETDRRLRAVIAAAELRIFPVDYAFAEFAPDTFPRAVQQDALAIVRDEDMWSQLVPQARHGGETFAIFSFHFPPALDNSGFVGWLATHLKRRFGTGVFVICGYHAARGGIYDYWGCPASLREAVLTELETLRRATRKLAA